MINLIKLSNHLTHSFFQVSNKTTNINLSLFFFIENSLISYQVLWKLDEFICVPTICIKKNLNGKKRQKKKNRKHFSQFVSNRSMNSILIKNKRHCKFHNSFIIRIKFDENRENCDHLKQKQIKTIWISQHIFVRFAVLKTSVPIFAFKNPHPPKKKMINLS